MKVSKKDLASFSQLLVAGAVVSIILAAVGWVGGDIWLASSQWLLVAAVLALFGIYLKK